MKKLIARRLPLSDTYKLIKIVHQDVETADCVVQCDNCDRAIVNIATIVNLRSQTFHVGLDCLRTLTLYDRNSADVDLISFDIAMRFMAKLKKAQRVEIDEYYVRASWRDAKGYLKNCNELKVCLERHGLLSNIKEINANQKI